MGKISALFILMIVLLGVGLFSHKNQNPEIEKVFEMAEKVSDKNIDVKATFEIYTNGTKRIFTDPRYHNLSQFVYITGDLPNTVNVKKEGITWANFFETLPMRLDKDCLTTGTGQVFCSGVERTLRFYLNDIEDPEALSKVIEDGNKLLVEYQ